MDLNFAKKEICKFCKMIHQKGWIAGTDGNVSVRINEREILITPSGVNKGFIEENDLIVINYHSGNRISGLKKPSLETNLHLEIYKNRHDINAVIHTHAPKSTALGILGLEIGENILPEIYLSMGKVPLCKYATPTTKDVFHSIEKFVKDHNAFLLSHHGTATIGDNLQNAYNRLEKVEHAAEIILLANSAGKIKKISKSDFEKLIVLKSTLFGVN